MSQRGRDGRTAGNRMSAVERRFIKDKYGVLSIREIAEKLGKSKSAVGREVKALRAKGEIAPEQRPPKAPVAKDIDRMPYERLLELADTLRALLANSDERNSARLAAEYRATLMEIQKIDAQSDGGGKGEALAILLDSLRP